MCFRIYSKENMWCKRVRPSRDVAIVVNYVFSSTEFGFIWEGADGHQSETGKSLSLTDKKSLCAGRCRTVKVGVPFPECTGRVNSAWGGEEEAKLHHRKEEKKFSCLFVWRTAILCAIIYIANLQSSKMVRTAPDIRINGRMSMC